MGDKHFEIFACYSLAFAVGFVMLLLDASSALTAYLVKFVPLGSVRRNVYLQDFADGVGVVVADNPFVQPLPADIIMGLIAPWLCVF